MWYGLAAPLAIIALPLAALLLPAAVRGLRGRVAAGVAGGLSLWWLLGAGDLPDQTLRAAALMAAVAFAVLTRQTVASFTHRALAALAVAAAGTTACFLAFGWSWDRLHWWIAFRTGPVLRLILGSAGPAGGDGGAGSVALGSGPRAFEQFLDRMVTISADLFPAAIALQLLAGLWIAALLARRLAGEAAGVAPGPLAEFRFSEHLGWALVLAVACLLIPPLAPARTMALNVLVVLSALYALRGLAVITFGIRAVKGGLLLYLAAALAILFVLPGVVLLGVLDAGLNLRRRWLPPRGA